MHWDKQTIPTLNDNTKEKRLSVSVSEKKHKLLGVPSLGGGSLKNIYGQTVCNTVIDELQKWKCVNSINGMDFTLLAPIQGFTQVLV